jgi:pimeloyl-ACP methyl ester carboxylesterase
MQFVFNLLYSTDFVSILPLLIHNAHERGEFTPLVAQALVFREDAALYYGLLYSVACSEDAPFISLPEARELRQDTYFPLMAESFLQVCDQWPQGDASAGIRQPVESQVPVLLLSGGADPVTPPRYARQVAEALPNSRHLVAPGYGHGILVVGCVPDIVTDFIANGTLETVETGCLEELQPPPFFVDFAGPRP